MRTIKFKAKSKLDGLWYVGDLIHAGEDEFIKPESERNSLFPQCKKAIPDTLCQFTGFLDKNGKEIYEGDVIHIRPDNCVVIWVEELGGFYLKADYAKDPCATPLGAMLRSYDFEVIGNIYEQRWTMRTKVPQRKNGKEADND